MAEPDVNPVMLFQPGSRAQKKAAIAAFFCLMKAQDQRGSRPRNGCSVFSSSLNSFGLAIAS